MFGMGTGVAPPLSPPEFGAAPHEARPIQFSELVLPCQAYSRNRYQPTRPSASYIINAWLGGSGHSEHRQNPQELRCHHPHPHNQAIRMPHRGSDPCQAQLYRPQVRPQRLQHIYSIIMTTAKGDSRTSIKNSQNTRCIRHYKQPATLQHSTQAAAPKQRMIAMVKPLGRLVLLG